MAGSGNLTGQAVGAASVSGSLTVYVPPPADLVLDMEAAGIMTVELEAAGILCVDLEAAGVLTVELETEEVFA